MINLKLSSEVAEKLGIKSADDAIKLLSESATNREKTADFESRLKAVEDALPGIRKIAKNAHLKADEAEAAFLDSKPKGELLSLETVTQIARDEAAAAAVNAIGSFGNTGVGDDAENQESAGSQKPAADDYKAQWDADPNLHDEFTDSEAYAAYAKASAGGRVKILKKIIRRNHGYAKRKFKKKF